ncbi:hypothetical protein PIB30_021071 [Stylosanthes scabra]|uniref:Uncharacterized protein n=1 Tax=Stylosanthes scabra TaxID=79078 RepID=A0ABU6XA46_9FABA|nr:hypothetical protein [Stylosanthes scabra]
MSNSVSHSIFYQTLLCRAVSEYESKAGSSNSLFQAWSANKGLYPPKKLLLSTNFRGNKLCASKRKLGMGKLRNHAVVPHAVLTTNPSSQLSGKFNLEGNIELQVGVSSSAPEGATVVDVQVSSSSGYLVLHWGVICDGQGFKNNGENFHIKLVVKDKIVQQVSVPEDLVQVQAYLRWERKGKQLYTPEQEKEEYEAARRELQEEVASGTSVQDLRARLTKKTDSTEVKEPSVSETKPSGSETKTIPDELVQIQAYIRWEKAGKPNYSPEQQLLEFEEAKRELLAELDKGPSLDEIRKKITKGEIQTKVAKQLKTKKYFSVERIQRKKRDLTQLINRKVSDSDAKSVAENVVEQTPKALRLIERYAKEREEHDRGFVLNKTIYKLAADDLLVLVTNDAGKIKVHLATDSKMPITVHWALSQTKPGEWLVPPASTLPPGSVTMNEAAETPFKAGSSSQPSYEVSSKLI